MRRPVDVPYRITTEHGEPSRYAKFGRHSGVDYAKPAGSPVYAPAPGTIRFAGYTRTGGNMIVLFDGQFYHRFMHNSKLHVKAGQAVVEGQHIAAVGTTGLSTGNHLHWDISKREYAGSFDDFVHPWAWLTGAYGIYHVVARGENLSMIASRYGTTWRKIWLKNIPVIGWNPNTIKAGMRLRI